MWRGEHTKSLMSACVSPSHSGAGSSVGAAATWPVACTPHTSPAGVWVQEVTQSSARQLGSTFLLHRSARDQTTEGVEAPSCLQHLGITTMLDLADAFLSEQEVRAAIGAAAQTDKGLAVQAWRQCRRRAPALTRQLAAGRPSPHGRRATSPPRTYRGRGPALTPRRSLAPESMRSWA